MCNHANHPPNIFADEHPNELEDDDRVDNPDEVEDDGSSAQRARWYSKTPRDAEPKSTTMKYYPPCWKTMLEIAKNSMRKHVAFINAFP